MYLLLQRHCRLKHSGDIKVLVGSKPDLERMEVDDNPEELDHVDLPQVGTFKCSKCPFSNDVESEFEKHLEGHSISNNVKCGICDFSVNKEDDLFEHLKLHGINEPEEYLGKFNDKNDGDFTKKYKCIICPYVTNSKSQYLYHKQFHKSRGGPYTCTYCNYNVTKRHLLNQHLKVHADSILRKQKEDIGDINESSDENEDSTTSVNDSQKLNDIALVWVSKNGKFSKMFKCRYCPHVNLRKVNIQEHEKMHGIREKNPNSAKLNDIEHHCSECNYVCNNAGVLSSHSKVHQGQYGTIHGLVDNSRTDEEQIQELNQFIGNVNSEEKNIQNCFETKNFDDSFESSDMLYFCQSCPARFLKENEYTIHTKFHDIRLIYKCDYCTYTARQKPHLLAHYKVHSNEYQERTKVLQTCYSMSPDHLPPLSVQFSNNDGEYVWIINDNGKLMPSLENDFDNTLSNKPTKLSIPLSGTELFLHKSEAQQKQATEGISNSISKILPTESQIESLMHGNPNFTYPTYLKNGKLKEKRYKCNKCPSAFEKREQYRVHLSLHGSKQKYNCEHCDYSVKYYANYVQHIKKHKTNSQIKIEEDNEDSANEEEKCNLEAPFKKVDILVTQETDTQIDSDIQCHESNNSSQITFDNLNKFNKNDTKNNINNENISSSTNNLLKRLNNNEGENFIINHHTGDAVKTIKTDKETFSREENNYFS